MFLNLVCKILEWTGNRHLVPFIKSIVHMGRPSHVFFPKELIEQGLSIILSGLNNAMAMQTTANWVWPFWVQQQSNPDTKDFIPTGLNLLKTNLSNRNWTGVGVLDFDQEGMVDPVGMLSVKAYGWSLFSFVRLNDVDYLPPLMEKCIDQRSLAVPEDGVETRYTCLPGLKWSHKVRGVQHLMESVLWSEISLKNTSHETQTVSLGMTVRPYNGLTLSHMNRLHYRKNYLRINHKPSLVLLDDPDVISLSDRHLGDPLLKTKKSYPKRYINSKTGISCAVFEYHLVLQPGESRSINALSLPEPKTNRSQEQGRVTSLLQNPLLRFTNTEAVKQSYAVYLEKLKAQNTSDKILAGEDRVSEHLFNTIGNRLHVYSDKKGFTPGHFLYHQHWFRDSVFLSTLFDKLGRPDDVRRSLVQLKKKQRKDGYFLSQEGEWDSNGQAIYTAVHHFRCYGDITLMRQYWRYLLRGCKWIVETRRKDFGDSKKPFGLLPAGFSAEHFGPNDFYFWDNFWALRGLKEVYWVASVLHEKEAQSWLSHEIQSYLRDIQRHIIPFSRKGSALPSSPLRKPDTACIGILAAISPLDLFNVNTSWVENTVEYLMQNNIRRGMFFQKIVHTGLNAYLTVQLARVLLLLGDPRWKDLYEGLIAAASPTLTWPEAIHPRLIGGCMGDGDHGWAAAEMMHLVRERWIMEHMHKIYIGLGLSFAKLEENRDLGFLSSPGPFGTVSFILRRKGQQIELYFENRRNEVQQKAEIILVLPAEIRLSGNRKKYYRKGERRFISLGKTDREILNLSIKA